MKYIEKRFVTLPGESTMNSPENRILWLFVALLLAVIAGIVVGWLSYEGNAKKAMLCGLAAFGGALVASVTIENQTGII
jgi:zinc transporter ZupT